MELPSPAVPPDTVAAGVVWLRRGSPEDADALAQAVNESLEHLSPWMPWATPDAALPETQRRRLSESGWGPDDYGYVMIANDGGIVGACGLHRRVGPTALEIGYWVHVDHTRKGYASAAAAALTQTALALPGVERVEIHCDATNHASAAIPRRLGYRLDRIEDHTIDSPAQTGRCMIWIIETGT